MGAISRSIAHIKHRHALELAREVARALRTSGQAAAEQGRLNWATVQQAYGQDTTNADRAQSRLESMADRERERERTRQAQRRELHLANPISDEDISRNLSGETVPVPANRRNQRPGPSESNTDDSPQSSTDKNSRQGNGVNADNSRNQTQRPDQSRNNNRGSRNNRGQTNRSRSRSPRSNGRPNNRGGRGNRSYSRRRDNSRGRSNNNDRRNGGNNRNYNRSSYDANSQWGTNNRDPNNAANRGNSVNPRDGLGEVIARVVAEFDRQRARNNNA